MIINVYQSNELVYQFEGDFEEKWLPRLTHANWEGFASGEWKYFLEGDIAKLVIGEKVYAEVSVKPLMILGDAILIFMVARIHLQTELMKKFTIHQKQVNGSLKEQLSKLEAEKASLTAQLQAIKWAKALNPKGRVFGSA